MKGATAKIITKIAANPLLVKTAEEYRQLRVAAYCRVSTDSSDQLESYKAQVSHYTDAISKNPKWRLIDIYADEGITGTATKKRENFNRMIRDCEKGRIDLILTKSVARFARNTVDSLKYVRKLKEKGVGVYFEEQSLDTMKTENEMALGLYSVMAQAESENISANVRWGIQQRMKSGTFAFRYNLLGYKKGEDGKPTIVPEEAEIINTIYKLYLDGSSLGQIQEFLQNKDIRTKSGKDKWNRSIISGILSNEKYTGDMLLQKTYVENCISKKTKKNRGEFAKYLITNNHPPIIDKETFKQVQMEMARRSGKKKISTKTITELGKYSGKYALTELLVCGECGSPYRRKTYIDYGGKKRAVWRCLNRLDNGRESCEKSITIDENELHTAICRCLQTSINDKIEAKDAIMSAYVYSFTKDDDVLDVYAIEQQIKEYKGVLDDTIMLAARTTGDKTKFENEIKRVSDQIVALKEKVETEKSKVSSSRASSEEIIKMKELLSRKDCFSTYREEIVRQVIEYIRVMSDGKLLITLKGGITVEEQVKGMSLTKKNKVEKIA